MHSSCFPRMVSGLISSTANEGIERSRETRAAAIQVFIFGSVGGWEFSGNGKCAGAGGGGWEGDFGKGDEVTAAERGSWDAGWGNLDVKRGIWRKSLRESGLERRSGWVLRPVGLFFRRICGIESSVSWTE